MLPLTEALAAPTVRFTLTHIGTDSQSVTLPPRDLDLTQAGHVVSLTWEDMP